MKVETKYDIGDKVLAILQSKIHTVWIEEIKITKNNLTGEDPEIVYKVENKGILLNIQSWVQERRLFKDKKELLKYIDRQC